jgi:hypothetical protein
MKCEAHKDWIEGCKACQADHYAYHCRNEDMWDAHDVCPLCGPKLRERKHREWEERKRAGIEKRKRTMAAKKLAAAQAKKEPPMHRVMHKNKEK